MPAINILLNTTIASKSIFQQVTQPLSNNWKLTQEAFVSSSGRLTSFAVSVIVVGSLLAAVLLLVCANFYVQRWTQNYLARNRRIMRPASADEPRVLGGFGSTKAPSKGAHIKMTMMMSFDKPSTSTGFFSKAM